MSRDKAPNDTWRSDPALQELAKATLDLEQDSHTARVANALARERDPQLTDSLDLTECLLEDELLEYQAGQCSEAQLARLDAHLDGCPVCRELVHHLLGAEQPSGDDDLSSPSGWLTTFSPGSVVNARYQIQRFVGKGGMGEVYEAFDRLMAMRVALKTVICTASDRPHAVRKLMDEVRNALRVGHPNVCRINELQEHHDPQKQSAPVPFFTMEFVDGERLGDRLKHGPLPLDEVRLIAHQLLDGLKAAHARGVLHLDFKSENVMVRHGTGAPEVVIMDFGLSRAVDRQLRQRTSERMQLAGTLPYMSLEQLECRPMLGPEADIYSFGVVLYEMLTGRMPFEAETLGAMLLRQLKHRPLPPSHFVPSLSPALDRFVTRCLRSDSKDRYPDAGSAMAALDAIAGWERPRKWRARPWQVFAGAVVCSALLLGGAGVFRGTDAPVDVRERIEMSTTLAEAGALAPRSPQAPEGVAPPTEREDTVERQGMANADSPGQVTGGAVAELPSVPAPDAKAVALERVQPSSAEELRAAPASSITTGATLNGVQLQRSGSAATRADDAPARRASAEGTPPTEPNPSGNVDWTPRAVPKALLLPPTKSPPPAASGSSARPAAPGPSAEPPNAPAPPAAVPVPPAAAPTPPSAQAPTTSPGDQPPPAAGQAAPPTVPARSASSAHEP